MKKLFTLCMGLLAALAIQAQSDFPIQFADKDGNIIADGTTLNLTDYVTDDFGDVQVPANLYVKNITDGEVQIGGKYTITSLSSGAFQTCFPENCIRQTKAGNYETESGALAAGALKSMQTEWFPGAEGTAVVTYHLWTFKYNSITKKWTFDKEGPAVTLNFTYSTSGVGAQSSTSNVQRTTYYDLMGREVATPAHGLFVKKSVYADGTTATRKYLVR